MLGAVTQLPRFISLHKNRANMVSFQNAGRTRDPVIFLQI